MRVEVRRLGPGDEAMVLAAGALFDGPPDPAATRRFLSEATHHLLLAYDAAGEAVGFVSGIEVTHPDKGTELLLYELGVAGPVRRRGIGTTLVGALEALARERGCSGMWVLADADDTVAQATYARAGGRVASRPVLLEWDLGGRAAGR
jgi:ribosomal protein S18 acetylase RimI-like enzyme